jgi:hypothetical protein
MNQRRPEVSRAAKGGDAEDAARAAKMRRTAWLLAAFAVLFYLGYMSFMYLGSASGG